jgi:hypothetical protein
MKKTVTFETVREMMRALPGVEEGESWGTPAFRVRNKLLARQHEDGETLVLKCADRELLIASDPKAFFVTKHYENYPWVLVRLAKVRPAALRDLIEQAWRAAASAKLIRLHESGAYTPPPPAPPASPRRSPTSLNTDQQTRVRRLCQTLAEVEEKEAWGAPTFRVKGKMFAMYVYNHHGDGRVALWLKAPPGVQALLSDAEPDKFFIPPYQGPAGWIGVDLDRCPDDEIAFHLRQAYTLVAPPRLLASIR